MGSVALAFVKNLTYVMSLDPMVEEEVEELNRNLLRLLELEEFSPNATFMDPCSTFIIKDLICRYVKQNCEAPLSWVNSLCLIFLSSLHKYSYISLSGVKV